MKARLSIITIIVFVIITGSIRFSNPNWGVNNDYGILSWDNFGYYLYLPAHFIYDDLELENLQWIDSVKTKYSLPGSFYQAHKVEGKGHVIQYTSGMSVVYLPAFWAGHLYALSSESHDADGFSTPYHFSVLLEAFIIIIIGLFFLRLFLLKYFTDLTTSIILLLFLFGTNYFQIVISNTSTPHAILFSFYAILLYYTNLWHTSYKLKHLILVSVFFSLLTLCRANELISILLFIFWRIKSVEQFKERFRTFLRLKKQLTLALLIPCLIGSLQVIYWKFSSGEWVFDSYINEDFKLYSPYLFNFLFSYKKGWLLYTPIMIFSFIGLFYLYKRKRELFFPISLFIFINVWVLSSWDCWWYADSFSQRSIVQSYPVFILPFGFFIQQLFDKPALIKVCAYIILLLLVGLNLFQTYQQRLGVLHTSRMTKNYYWKVFGKTNVEQSTKNLLEPERNISYIPENLTYSKAITFNMIYEDKIMMNEENPFTEKYSMPFSQVSADKFPYFKGGIRIKVDRTSPNATIGIVYGTVDSKSDKNYGYNYKSVPLTKDLIDGNWHCLSSVYTPPYLRNKDDLFEVYLWLNGEAQVQVDWVSILSFEPVFNQKSSSKFFFGFPFEESPKNWSKGVFSKSKQHYVIDSLNPYSATFISSYKALKNQFNSYMIEVDASEISQENEIYAVVSITNENDLVMYKSHPIKEQSQNKWSFQENIPNDIPEEAEIRFYLWNKSKHPYQYRSLIFTLSE